MRIILHPCNVEMETSVWDENAVPVARKTFPTAALLWSIAPHDSINRS
jgi:hypothetical protein